MNGLDITGLVEKHVNVLVTTLLDTRNQFILLLYIHLAVGHLVHFLAFFWFVPYSHLIGWLMTVW